MCNIYICLRKQTRVEIDKNRTHHYVYNCWKWAVTISVVNNKTTNRPCKHLYKIKCKKQGQYTHVKATRHEVKWELVRPSKGFQLDGLQQRELFWRGKWCYAVYTVHLLSCAIVWISNNEKHSHEASRPWVASARTCAGSHGGLDVRARTKAGACLLRPVPKGTSKDLGRQPWIESEGYSAASRDWGNPFCTLSSYAKFIARMPLLLEKVLAMHSTMSAIFCFCTLLLKSALYHISSRPMNL
jgi:hypothetical protein